MYAAESDRETNLKPQPPQTLYREIDERTYARPCALAFNIDDMDGNWR
jgi:hypothetical protein